MARKRKQLSKRQRFEVFKRDGFTCQYCGRTPPVVVLQADHIVAIAEGGADHESNMVTACADCNAGKSAVPLGQVPQALAEQIQVKRDRAEQTREYSRFLMELRAEEDQSIEAIGIAWYDHMFDKKGRTVFGESRVPSIRTFLKSLPAAKILDAVEIAHAKYEAYGPQEDDRTFRYFCGICWRMIKEGK